MNKRKLFSHASGKKFLLSNLPQFTHHNLFCTPSIQCEKYRYIHIMPWKITHRCICFIDLNFTNLLLSGKLRLTLCPSAHIHSLSAHAFAVIMKNTCVNIHSYKTAIRKCIAIHLLSQYPSQQPLQRVLHISAIIYAGRDCGCHMCCNFTSNAGSNKLQLQLISIFDLVSIIKRLSNTLTFQTNPTGPKCHITKSPLIQNGHQERFSYSSVLAISITTTTPSYCQYNC